MNDSQEVIDTRRAISELQPVIARFNALTTVDVEPMSHETQLAHYELVLDWIRVLNIAMWPYPRIQFSRFDFIFTHMLRKFIQLRLEHGIYSRKDARDYHANTQHWPPIGEYKHSVAGILYYKDDLESLIPQHQNEVVHLCLANLVPEPENSFDPNAVAVYVEGKKIGHLPRETANEYTVLIRRIGVQDYTLTCDAMLCRSARGFLDAYLDFDAGMSPMADIKPTFSASVSCRVSPYFKIDDNGSVSIAVHPSHGDFEYMKEGLPADCWAAPHWDTINIYVEHKQGCGPGLKILEIPREKFKTLFGGDTQEDYPDVSVERDGVYLWVTLKRTERA